jgi:hypothetical protein
MIMARNEEERNTVLKQLQKFQRADFEGILEAMDGLQVRDQQSISLISARPFSWEGSRV